MNNKNKRLADIYIIFNIISVLIIFIASIIQIMSDNKIASIVVLGGFILWSTINVVVIISDILFRKKLSKVISKLIQEEEYEACIEYLRSCRGKGVFKANEDIITYNIAYIELLADNVEKGVKILKDVDLNKQYKSNYIITVNVIYLLYLYGYVYDETLRQSMDKVYKEKYDIILKNKKSDARVDRICQIIKLLQNNERHTAIKLIMSDSVSNIPFVKKELIMKLNH